MHRKDYLRTLARAHQCVALARHSVGDVRASWVEAARWWLGHARAWRT